VLRFLSAMAVATVVACAPRVPAPPELPPPPTPIAPGSVSAASTPEPDDDRPSPRRAETAAAPTALPSRPQPTGDRERDALAMGIWGCRVLAQRIAPLASGKAVLRVHLGRNGEVLALTVWNAGVAQPVVQCLVDAVRATRFDPRGGGGSELEVPIDLARPDVLPPGTSPPAGTVSM
jgi:hypothetical protein